MFPYLFPLVSLSHGYLIFAASFPYLFPILLLEHCSPCMFRPYCNTCSTSELDDKTLTACGIWGLWYARISLFELRSNSTILLAYKSFSDPVASGNNTPASATNVSKKSSSSAEPCRSLVRLGHGDFRDSSSRTHICLKQRIYPPTQDSNISGLVPTMSTVQELPGVTILRPRTARSIYVSGIHHSALFCFALPYLVHLLPFPYRGGQ